MLIEKKTVFLLFFRIDRESTFLSQLFVLEPVRHGGLLNQVQQRIEEPLGPTLLQLQPLPFPSFDEFKKSFSIRNER